MEATCHEEFWARQIESLTLKRSKQKSSYHLVDRSLAARQAWGRRRKRRLGRGGAPPKRTNNELRRGGRNASGRNTAKPKENISKRKKF